MGFFIQVFAIVVLAGFSMMVRVELDFYPDSILLSLFIGVIIGFIVVKVTDLIDLK